MQLSQSLFVFFRFQCRLISSECHTVHQEVVFAVWRLRWWWVRGVAFALRASRFAVQVQHSCRLITPSQLPLAGVAANNLSRQTEFFPGTHPPLPSLSSNLKSAQLSPSRLPPPTGAGEFQRSSAAQLLNTRSESAKTLQSESLDHMRLDCAKIELVS